MIFFLFFFLVFSAPSYATEVPPSFFFSPDEMQKITQEIKKSNQTTMPKHVIRLDSLMYFGKDRWTLWMQGKKWTPKTQSKDIEILSVTPTHATLSITLQGSMEKKKITLHTNQSFDLLTGEPEGHSQN